MNKKCGAKFRKIHNRITNEFREVYSAVIYKESAINGEILVANSNNEIMEFESCEKAFEEARKTYEKFKGELWD